MFAVDHAATALLIKQRYPSVPMTPLLFSVQAMELAWVGLNYAGIERTTTEPVVRSVADIHLAYMPFSHSVASAAGGALLAWLVVEKGLRRPLLGRAIGIGIVSHLVLDLMTHAPDIAWWPGSSWPPIGLGLYNRAPMWGFALEMAYGVLCWWVFHGRRALLAAIVLGNLANLSMFSATIPGPEEYLAGHPLMVVTVVFIQIVVMLALVGFLSERSGDGGWVDDHHGDAQHTETRRGSGRAPAHDRALRGTTTRDPLVPRVPRTRRPAAGIGYSVQRGMPRCPAASTRSDYVRTGSV